MQKTLTFDEYVTCFTETVDAWTVFIVRQYFKSDVNAFYNAPSKFKEWSTEKDFLKRKTLFKPAWNGIMAFNFSAVSCKYVKRIFGRNYFSGTFMEQARKKLADLGYRKVNRGTLSYKGVKHQYCAKYLPPKEKMNEIFATDGMADIVTNPSTHCNKVKKILTAMKKEHLPEDIMNKVQKKKPVMAAKPVTSVKKSPSSATFQTPVELLNALKKLLDTGKVGTPASFKRVLRPILTDYLLRDLDEYWNAKPFTLRNKFDYVNWLSELPVKDRVAVYVARHEFFSKVLKQLNSHTDAFGMFKDEYVQGEFVPADEKRVNSARESVRKALVDIEKTVEMINSPVKEDDE